VIATTSIGVPVTNAATLDSRSGWRGHIWAVALSGIMGSLAPYFIGAALAFQYGVGGPIGESAASYVSIAISLGEIFRLALAPVFWFGIALWFIGCTAQLRRR
jgi:hypothetical protein